ncbi:kinase A anchor protein [Gamsiella multidivaricata]|uniref:kinase A anchor protein n=1 Tax=Gamsiella multidivaricata TaxID=101098 RepID=UPI00221F7AD4|nr:kinase A anchor protein [Gamsiella multidivaricata]KAI7828219.1 kinase A anchor protein [Gamsiella multidivaricata]
MSSKPVFTHFLALPLYTSTSANRLNTSLSRFAAEVTTPGTPTTASEDLTSSIEQLSLSKAASEHNESVPTTNNTNSPPCQARRLTSPLATSVPRSITAPLPREALRPIASLHLTLGMMSLGEASELERAAAFLKTVDVRALLESAATTAATAESTSIVQGNASSSSIPKEPLSIEDGSTRSSLIVTLRSLVPMHALESTSVLYAVPHDASGRLYPFCKALQAAFIEAGFMAPDERGLKLHATIVNTLHARARAGGVAKSDFRRQGQGQGQGQWQRWRTKNKVMKIDATELVERWKDEIWAEVQIEKVAICEKGVKMASDGLMRYREVAEIDMP